jgi:hypothetical protein
MEATDEQVLLAQKLETMQREIFVMLFSRNWLRMVARGTERREQPTADVTYEPHVAFLTASEAFGNCRTPLFFTSILYGA